MTLCSCRIRSLRQRLRWNGLALRGLLKMLGMILLVVGIWRCWFSDNQLTVTLRLRTVASRDLLLVITAVVLVVVVLLLQWNCVSSGNRNRTR